MEELKIKNFEKVIKTTLHGNVTAFIAIHNTKLGPALGGLRFYPYETELKALDDVCNLAEAMTYKAALADLELGGGKAVIMGDPQKIKTPALLKSFADFLNTLNGQYITAKDVGINLEDLNEMATHSKWVAGTSQKGSSGDPSIMTAYGVFEGVMAAAKFVWGIDRLSNKTILIQGLGGVGFKTFTHLLRKNIKIIATDTNDTALENARKKFSIETVAPDKLFETKADIFCPCAMGQIVNSHSIRKLSLNGVKIIAGGANNQLEKPEKDGQALHDHSILYAPDYVINAGGLINIAVELKGYDESLARSKTQNLASTLTTIFEKSKRDDRPTSLVALEMAHKKLS